MLVTVGNYSLLTRKVVEFLLKLFSPLFSFFLFVMENGEIVCVSGGLEAWFPGPPLLDVASPVECDI